VKSTLNARVLESFEKKAYLLIVILLFVPVLVIIIPSFPALAERDIIVLLCTAMHFTSAPMRILSIAELCGRNVLKSAAVLLLFHIYIYMPLRLTPISSALLTRFLAQFHGAGFLLKKLTGSELFKIFPIFYATQSFITAFTSVRHLSISGARSVQYISSPLHNFTVYNYPLFIYLFYLFITLSFYFRVCCVPDIFCRSFLGFFSIRLFTILLVRLLLVLAFFISLCIFLSSLFFLNHIVLLL
jgi:hypothetical protein